MLLRIFAITFILVCASVAWVILGATIDHRTSQSNDQLRSGVASIWGSPQEQGPPADINARVAEADLKVWQSQSSKHELLRSALRAALKERCKLALHEEPAQEPTWEVVIGKRGPRLGVAAPAAPPGANASNTAKLKSGGLMVQSVVNGKQVKHFYGATIDDLDWFLVIMSRGVPVYDKTGLTGRYDFVLREVEPLTTDPLDKYPLDQLGLELKRGTENRPALVIDHIERPSAN